MRSQFIRIPHEPLQAVRLFAAAETIRQSLQEDWRPSVDVIQERIHSEQRQRLGETAYQAAWQEGRVFQVERAVAEAPAVISTLMTRNG